MLYKLATAVNREVKYFRFVDKICKLATAVNREVKCFRFVDIK